MAIALIAVALQVSSVAEWKRPNWGSSTTAVSGQLGAQIIQDQNAAKRDILGMEEPIHGKMSFRDFPSKAQFFFVHDRLSAITVKLEDPRSCPRLEKSLRGSYGMPLLSQPSAPLHTLFDVWDDPHNSDRITLQGTDAFAPAPFCTVFFGPPRQDRFNGRAKANSPPGRGSVHSPP